MEMKCRKIGLKPGVNITVEGFHCTMMVKFALLGKPNDHNREKWEIVKFVQGVSNLLPTLTSADLFFHDYFRELKGAHLHTHSTQQFYLFVHWIKQLDLSIKY